MQLLEMTSVDTPVGPARVDIQRGAGRSRLALVLGHGAGGGIDARDLVAIAEALPARGITVVRVEQPWRVAGRRVAVPPPTLDVAWRAVLTALPELVVAGSLVVGGRSAGARVACRTAASTGAIGCLALAFPLHPPGRPEKSRLSELLGAGVPTLVLQGERDPFGGPNDFPADGPFSLRRVPFGDHGFRTPAAAPLTQAEALELLVEATCGWLRTL